MDILIHTVIFAAAIAAIWFFAGVIVESVDRVARRFNKNSFIIAFFLLGLLTSLGELSVAVNAIIEGVPQVSAGNLIGASFVLLLFVVPIIAVVAGRITMNKIFDGWRLAYVLVVIALPALFFVDGSVSQQEGVAALLFLASLLWVIRNYEASEQVKEVMMHTHSRSHLFDIGKVVVSAGIVFLAGRLLVDEAVYFSDLFNAPQSLMGMILLSVGTNIPEIAIAVRSVIKGRFEVALGNYLGSATMNTATFALLAIVAGPFAIEQSEFVISFLFTLVGFVLFYCFVRSRDTLTRREGIVLLSVYALFLIAHLVL